MPRGGIRPNAGRPTRTATTTSPGRVDEPQGEYLTPLSYLLAVMRKPGIDPVRRDKAAGLLLPFMHSKVTSEPLGKKEKAQRDAEMAGKGTHWGSLLAWPPEPLDDVD